MYIQPACMYIQTSEIDSVSFHLHPNTFAEFKEYIALFNTLIKQAFISKRNVKWSSKSFKGNGNSKNCAKASERYTQ